jgi:hypothetical protein
LNDPSKWARDDLGNDDYVDSETQGGMPPKELLIEVGISHGEAYVLANQNDAGTTFEEIADMIENGEIYTSDYDCTH